MTAASRSHATAPVDSALSERLATVELHHYRGHDLLTRFAASASVAIVLHEISKSRRAALVAFRPLFDKEVGLCLALSQVRFHPARRWPSPTPLFATWPTIFRRLFASRVFRHTLGARRYRDPK